MAHSSKILSVVSLVVFTLISGCVKAPDQQIAAAKEALQQAKAVEAETYAKEEFNTAQNAFDDANAALNTELKKMAFLRNYEKTNKLFVDATELSWKAVATAKTGKERVAREMAKTQAEKRAQESAKKTKAKKR
jgi:uncharacterized cupredoxin-like copper-binding protein